VIIGSGPLAHGIVCALSQAAAGSVQMAIIGRSGAKVSQMALIANAREASFGTRPVFFPVEIPEFRAAVFSRGRCGVPTPVQSVTVYVLLAQIHLFDKRVK
jgi:hypothetical protein